MLFVPQSIGEAVSPTDRSARARTGHRFRSGFINTSAQFERKRRMSNLTIVRSSLVTLVFAGFAALSVAQPPQPPPLTMKQLTPDVWVGLGGAGGNSTIIIGKTSVIVVDAGPSGLHHNPEAQYREKQPGLSSH